jgi:hypothetical protein
LADPDDVEVQKYISSKVVDLSIPSILSCCSAIYEDNESLTRRTYQAKNIDEQDELTKQKTYGTQDEFTKQKT